MPSLHLGYVKSMKPGQPFRGIVLSPAGEQSLSPSDRVCRKILV